MWMGGRHGGGGGGGGGWVEEGWEGGVWEKREVKGGLSASVGYWVTSMGGVEGGRLECRRGPLLRTKCVGRRLCAGQPNQEWG